MRDMGQTFALTGLLNAMPLSWITLAAVAPAVRLQVGATHEPPEFEMFLTNHRFRYSEPCCPSEDCA